jgi:hypothetical protein
MVLSSNLNSNKIYRKEHQWAMLFSPGSFFRTILADHQQTEHNSRIPDSNYIIIATAGDDKEFTPTLPSKQRASQVRLGSWRSSASKGPLIESKGF